MRKHTLLTFGRGSLAFAASIAAFGISAASAGEGGAHPAQAPVAQACETYTVQPGDTLGAIAQAVTGSRSAAGMIFKMNSATLASPDDIVVGQVLKMPCAGPYTLQDGKGAKTIVAPEAEMQGWVADPGDYLVDVLTAWGEKSGYNVIVEGPSDWRFGVGYQAHGDFRAAVDEVIAGFASAAVPPVVVFYNNNVMTIGVR